MNSNNIYIKIKFLVITLILLFYSDVFSQGYYYIEFRMYQSINQVKTYYGDKYECLLIDYGSSESVMRVRYNNNVIEQKMTSYYSGEYWYFKGSDVKFITPGYGYEPDKIVLKRNREDNYYYPSYVYDENQNIFGDIITFTVLQSENISNELLGRFHWRWSESTDYYNLENTTLYLILVSATGDMDLGAGSSKNHERLYRLFKESADIANINFSPIEIKDYEFNKETLSQKIRNLRVSDNDIIIFYYSGHGFRYENDNPWPQIKLTYRIGVNPSYYTYNLNDIYSELKNKGARLTLVFGECCNIYMGNNTPMVPDYPQFAPGGVLFERRSIRQLFSRKGSLLLSTSKPNQFSFYYSTTGGYFCTNFCDSFMQMVARFYEGEVSWDNLINSATWKTIRTSNTDDEPNNQQPQYYINIE